MIHRPKLIRSTVPYGPLNNTVISTKVTESSLVTSEFWNDSPKPIWKIGTLITARKGYTWKTTWELGKHFVVTKIYTEEGQLTGSYWNICSAVQTLEDHFAYEDWYLDVWVPVKGILQLLDESELDEALERAYISLSDADMARWTAFKIIELCKNL